MKKIFSLVAGLIVASTMMAQEPVITFEKDTHDFGKINEADGRVTTVFKFKNEGPAPLVLSNVRASCGCTTPQWTREPIEPGATGAITVTYNPNGRPGKFSKTITVSSNAKEPTTRLYIKGEVIPKPVQPVVTYPIKVGELSLMSNQIEFGDVLMGQQKSISIEYANQTDSMIRIEVSQLSYMNIQVSLSEVPAKTTGKLVVLLDTKYSPVYGPLNASIYLTINGKQYSNDPIRVTANIKEDFSNMSLEDKMNAPIIEMDEVIDLGVIPAGKKMTKIIKMNNAGVGTLYIRRILAADELQFVYSKSGYKSGKREIRLVVNTENMAPGKVERTITVITNDPIHTIKTVKLSWEVQ